MYLPSEMGDIGDVSTAAKDKVRQPRNSPALGVGGNFKLLEIIFPVHL